MKLIYNNSKATIGLFMHLLISKHTMVELIQDPDRLRLYVSVRDAIKAGTINLLQVYILITEITCVYVGLYTTCAGMFANLYAKSFQPLPSFYIYVT